MYDESHPAGGYPDTEWQKNFRERLYALVWFLQDSGLLNKRFVEDFKEIEEVVVIKGDFTDLGYAFIKTGAVNRWLGSFDRNKKKSNCDVSYLNKQLEKLRK